MFTKNFFMSCVVDTWFIAFLYSILTAKHCQLYQHKNLSPFFCFSISQIFVENLLFHKQYLNLIFHVLNLYENRNVSTIWIFSSNSYPTNFSRNNSLVNWVDSNVAIISNRFLNQFLLWILFQNQNINLFFLNFIFHNLQILAFF